MRALVVALAVTAAAVCVSGASWSVLNENFATIAAAISCKDANTCLAPVGLNGEGSFIWLTTDGGQTWNTENEPFELMFLGCAMQGNSAVVADELTLLYNNATTAGSYVFSHGLGDFTVSSQNVEVFGGSGGSSYGAAGEDELNNGNGCSVSTNGGKNWVWHNVSALKTESRYGAYPSATTWYLSAGEWPENVNPASEETYRQLSSRVHINQRSATDLGVKLFASDEQRRALPGDPGWKAQIVKTTDGGKTWTSQFYDEGNFYFNQIGCTDVNHCCAVGESESNSSPGIRIYCTWNGGAQWTRQMYLPNPDFSIMALRWIDAQNGWAAGGDLNPLTFQGYFWQTQDGGKTWTNMTVPGQYGNDMSFPTPTKGYAVSFNSEDESSLLVYQ